MQKSTPSKKGNFNCVIPKYSEENSNPSPDCNENPFLKKKIVMESGKKLLINKKVR